MVVWLSSKLFLYRPESDLVIMYWSQVQTANAYTSYEHGTNNIYQHSMPGYSVNSLLILLAVSTSMTPHIQSTSNLDLTAQMLAMNTDIIPSPHNIEAPLPETHENDYWQTVCVLVLVSALYWVVCLNLGWGPTCLLQFCYKSRNRSSRPDGMSASL